MDRDTFSLARSGSVDLSETVASDCRGRVGSLAEPDRLRKKSERFRESFTLS